MRLTKPMIKAFKYVVQGENTLAKLAKAINCSISWADSISESLEEEGFIVKRSSYLIRGSRLVFEIANTPHALKMRELIFQYSGISFEEILADSKLLFLSAISEDWLDIKTAEKLSRTSKFMIDRYLRQLKNRGVVMKDKGLYKLNEKAWPLLKEFLVAYRNYSGISGNVKWKYNEEVLFEVNSENSISGSVTGFYKYQSYGMKIATVSALCTLPERELSSEEVFVHSLFELKDSRTLHLALVFYIKNKLKYKKVMPIAMKYGKYSLFENINKILNSKEEKLKFENLPEFDRKELLRIAQIYGVKDV